MKIYMDNCCFNRILDDRSNVKNYLERNSVILILELVEAGKLNFWGSDVLDKEINATPNLYKKNILQFVYGLHNGHIGMSEDIAKRALEIRSQSNIRLFDSLHLASAEAARADVLLTVDRKFMNNAERIQTKVKVMNPTNWLMEVMR